MAQDSDWAVTKKAGTYQESDLPGRCFRCGGEGHWVCDCTFGEEVVSTQLSQARVAFGLSQCSAFSRCADAPIPKVTDVRAALLSLSCFCGRPLFHNIADAQCFLQAVAAKDVSWPWAPSCAACSLPASPATIVSATPSLSATQTSSSDLPFWEARCAHGGTHAPTQLDSQHSEGADVCSTWVDTQEEASSQDNLSPVQKSPEPPPGSGPPALCLQQSLLEPAPAALKRPRRDSPGTSFEHNSFQQEAEEDCSLGPTQMWGPSGPSNFVDMCGVADNYQWSWPHVLEPASASLTPTWTEIAAQRPRTVKESFLCGCCADCRQSSGTAAYHVLARR